MEFIDHTGHIFSQPSFNTYPAGYEFETFKYIFYLEDDYVRRLSVGEWYIRPIRVLIHKDLGELTKFSVKVDSTVFKLIPGTLIQERLASGNWLELDEDSDDFKKELSLDEMMLIEDETAQLLTFYIAGNASEPATWTSNLLIEAQYNDGEKTEWCPITVGGVFYDECEELIINGKNMGVRFPKDIIKAIYPLTSGTSIYSSEVNEALFSQKVKEYMMNYMRLHGECGNMDQVRSALSFFEWGDHLKMSQLVRTDNEVITQYIRNFFEIENDILWRMEHFEASSMLSLYIEDSQETGEVPAQDYTKSFWGEMKPVLESLENKLIEVEYDNTGIKFYKPWFDYVRTELMLKLACLRHYYQKYFLPMHMMIQSAALQHRVHANDIKYLTKPFITINAETICAEEDRAFQEVIFPRTHILYAYSQKHYVDSNYNEFTNYDAEAEDMKDTDVYYIDDVCIDVPIKFVKKGGPNFFKCHLILERLNGPVMFESDFTFSQGVSDYLSFIIYPKLMNDWLSMNYWQDKHYCIHLLVNDVWYDYEFQIKVPEMQMIFGKLKYIYSNIGFRQLNGIHKDDDDRLFVDFQSFMYIPSLIDVSNIRFPEEVLAYGHDGVMDKFISMYHEMPSIIHPNQGGEVAKKYYNRVHYFKLLREDGTELPYTGEQDDTDAYRTDIIDLYRRIFNDDGTQRHTLVHGNLTYDVYLMHDSKYLEDYRGIIDEKLIHIWDPKWYLVMISRETIDKADEDETLDPPSIPQAMFDDLRGLTPSFVKSDNKWLINRMAYIASNGVNHFKTNDIIVGTIQNVELPFILADGSKWNIKPFSPGMQEDSEVESMTNTFLMSLGGDNTGYDPGYYNITVRYSLDGAVQNQRKHTGRILVER